MSLHALHCVIVPPSSLFTKSLLNHHINNQQSHMNSLFYISFLCQVLCLIIIETLHPLWKLCWVCSSLVGVMMRFLSFSGSQNDSSSLLVTTCQLCLLWILILFLHLTTNGDQSPNLKALTDFILVSAISFSQYDFGLWDSCDHVIAGASIGSLRETTFLPAIHYEHPCILSPKPWFQLRPAHEN